MGLKAGTPSLRSLRQYVTLPDAAAELGLSEQDLLQLAALGHVQLCMKFIGTEFGGWHFELCAPDLEATIRNDGGAYELDDAGAALRERLQAATIPMPDGVGEIFVWDVAEFEAGGDQVTITGARLFNGINWRLAYPMVNGEPGKKNRRDIIMLMPELDRLRSTSEAPKPAQRREDAFAPAINEAISRTGKEAPSAAEVRAQLVEMVEDLCPPLIAFMPNKAGIKYSDGGVTKAVAWRAIDERVRRRLRPSTR